MRKIVSVIKPFIFEQNIIVYEDGNKIDVVACNVNELPNNILQLANQYELTNIELAGPTSYLKGIKKQIQELELTAYETNNLEIKIISEQGE